MFDLRKIPMLRVLVPFFGGVLTGFRVSSATQIFELLFLLILLLLIVWILVLIIFIWQRRACKPGSIPWLISLLLCMLFFIAGAGTGIHSRPLDPGLPVDQVVFVRGEISGSPRMGNHSHSFELKTQLISSTDTSYQVSSLLKCYLSMPTDSILPAQGEIWQFSGTLLPIRNSGNPGSPDYRSIMGRKTCWYRFYVSSNEVPAHFNKKISIEERSLTPALIRSFVSDHWQGSSDELSLLKAVCLGDRSSLTDDMRQAYAAAGGMHLLAVSGLHVGLIWWVLMYMTAWMSLIFRNGIQRTILVVGLLWFYAFVTGFSSSVCRSVTMFSFFSLGRIMGERVHPLNVILASAFLLVLIEPIRLMDVGFQLSYTAIVGIITLHPLTVRVHRIKNRALRWVWEATSVSLAAQLSTAPLVIYYFHQLPIYALVSSLIAIPLLSLLIAVFVCSLPLILSGVMEQFISFLLVELARLMNRSMEVLSSLPGSVVDGLQLSRWNLMVWLLILLLGIVALYGKRRIAYLMGVLISVLLLGSSLSGMKRHSSSELIVSHFRGASMVIVRKGAQVDHYCWYRDSTSREYMQSYIAQNWSRRIFENQVCEMGDSEPGDGKISACTQVAKGVWMLGGAGFGGLVLTDDVNKQLWDRVYADSIPQKAGWPDFILLSGEPLLEGLQEKGWMTNVDLLIDGSNRKWYKERMKAEWDRFYLTDQSGAYVKRW